MRFTILIDNQDMTMSDVATLIKNQMAKIGVEAARVLAADVVEPRAVDDEPVLPSIEQAEQRVLDDPRRGRIHAPSHLDHDDGFLIAGKNKPR